MEIIITVKNGDELINSKLHKSEKEKEVSVSQYARFFDDGSPAWTRDPECNLLFLKMQQDYATNLLRTKGYLFLNDVYDMLGIPRSKAGQIVGWVYDKENPIGDNKVDFGLFDEYNSKFVNGYKNSILLDFNVDGSIIDRL